MRAQQTLERLFAARLNAGAIGDKIGTARGTDRVALLAGRLLRSGRMDPERDQNKGYRSKGYQQQKGKRRTIHRASSLEISSSQMVEARTTRFHCMTEIRSCTTRRRANYAPISSTA
jgi:hypothetical protein